MISEKTAIENVRKLFAGKIPITIKYNFEIPPTNNISWTEWYCSVKGCDKIIYNNMDNRVECIRHFLTHIPFTNDQNTITDQELPKTR